MIQEYLIVNEDIKKKAETFKREGITALVVKLDNVDAWIVLLSASGENEETAKKLSSIHDEIMTLCESPTVLAHGSSEYFNKKLFPLVNDFELKLRKLLYLYSALHKDDKSASNIKELEDKDFGSLFDMLFIDDAFIKDAKAKTNQTSWKYTKKELLKLITELDENVVWDNLLGKETIPSLRERFSEIRLYRNDVMHAHYINYNTYNSARKLYNLVNSEIDETISKIVKLPDDKIEEKSKEKIEEKTITISASPDYNDILHKAMRVGNDDYLHGYYSSLSKGLFSHDYISPSLDDALIKASQLESTYRLSDQLQRAYRLTDNLDSQLLSSSYDALVKAGELDSALKLANQVQKEYELINNLNSTLLSSSKIGDWDRSLNGLNLDVGKEISQAQKALDISLGSDSLLIKK